MAAMQLSFTTSICLGFVKPCTISIISAAAAAADDDDDDQTGDDSEHGYVGDDNHDNIGKNFYCESHPIFWL
jgi:hypothetical protein